LSTTTTVPNLKYNKPNMECNISSFDLFNGYKFSYNILSGRHITVKQGDGELELGQRTHTVYGAVISDILMELCIFELDRDCNPPP
jgi:hypothetical protein